MNDPHRRGPTPAARERDTASSPHSESARAREGRWALSLITIVVALFAGGAVGLAVGYAVASSSAAYCTPTDQWCELGAVLIGGAIGIGAAVVAYIVVGVVVVRRHRPRGRRAPHIAIHLAAPVVVAVALNILASVL